MHMMRVFFAFMLLAEGFSSDLFGVRTARKLHRIAYSLPAFVMLLTGLHGLMLEYALAYYYANSILCVKYWGAQDSPRTGRYPLIASNIMGIYFFRAALASSCSEHYILCGGGSIVAWEATNVVREYRLLPTYLEHVVFAFAKVVMSGMSWAMLPYQNRPSTCMVLLSVAVNAFQIYDFSFV
jgi:hypothetical protein